jgi:uncharacterized protein YjbI with pentapeptide repeats
MKIHAVITLLTLIIVTNPIYMFGQSQQIRREELSAEDQELIRARKANEEAQAEYYRELTRKLQQPSPTPVPPKTFSQSVAENPASVIGIIGTILAALFAALVGLITLYVNSFNAYKAQRDTQFYEALKRFGDKDSPTIRSSAAGLLAQMAQTEWKKVSIKRKWPFLTIERSFRHFTTALDQLLTGLLLEDNPVVLKSIGDAIEQIISHDPRKITEKLYHANLKIQEELGSLLAELFVVNGCETPPNPKDTTHTHWGLWEQAQSLTSYDQWVLRDFVLKSNSFGKRFRTFLQAIKTKGNEDIGSVLTSLQHGLRITSNRLQANVDLYCTALGQCHWEKGDHHCLHHSFLIGGNLALQSADLSFVDLSFSQLTGMWLFKANMENAGFIETDLKGASLHHGSLRDGWLTRAQLDNAGLEDMDLTNTKFAEAQINDWTKLKGSNWWESDFYLPAGRGEVDANLLEKLFELYGDAVPANLDEMHTSVRNFIESKRKETSKQIQQNTAE